MMKQILTICGLLVVMLVAVVGCMVIFDVMSMESAESIVLKFGGAIVLLGVCSALIMMLTGGGKSSGDD